MPADDRLRWFPFDPDAWLTDPLLRSLPPDCRAIWCDLLCLMHGSPERGRLLRPNGTPFVVVQQLAELSTGAVDNYYRKGVRTSLKTVINVYGSATVALPSRYRSATVARAIGLDLARLLGTDWRLVVSAIRVLVAAGVASIGPDGVVESRRMIADEKKRVECSKAAEKRWRGRDGRFNGPTDRASETVSIEAKPAPAPGAKRESKRESKRRIEEKDSAAPPAAPPEPPAPAPTPAPTRTRATRGNPRQSAGNPREDSGGAQNPSGNGQPPARNPWFAGSNRDWLKATILEATAEGSRPKRWAQVPALLARIVTGMESRGRSELGPQGDARPDSFRFQELRPSDAYSLIEATAEAIATLPAGRGPEYLGGRIWQIARIRRRREPTGAEPPQGGNGTRPP